MRPRVVQRGAIATRSPLSPYIDGLQWVAAGARSIASGVEAMKINAKVVGYGPDPERTQALVNVIVEFSGPTQSMTLSVIVPNEGEKNRALQRRKTWPCNLQPTGSSITEARGRSMGQIGLPVSRSKT